MWAAGITLYQMLTGLYPYWDTLEEARVDIKELVYRVLYKSVSLNRHEGVRDASPELRDLLSRLLARDPANRLTATEALWHPWITKYAPEVPRHMWVPPSKSPPLVIR